eukprot:CAMPEP_0198562676 /NCGR_PEP_ID=MMETSP1462-20131121/97535_1 /TAXON_ID=1333877 /ORGANISM="Brandtodinium nutriculum, Strain RCC3387" /LENGTH=40 /DNA_ID= /DNA_START= /DNA_END= /DNA_ORIENTATION=
MPNMYCASLSAGASLTAARKCFLTFAMAEDPFKLHATRAD